MGTQSFYIYLFTGIKVMSRMVWELGDYYYRYKLMSMTIAIIILRELSDFILHAGTAHAGSIIVRGL